MDNHLNHPFFFPFSLIFFLSFFSFFPVLSEPLFLVFFLPIPIFLYIFFLLFLFNIFFLFSFFFPFFFFFFFYFLKFYFYFSLYFHVLITGILSNFELLYKYRYLSLLGQREACHKNFKKNMSALVCVMCFILLKLLQIHRQ